MNQFRPDGRRPLLGMMRMESEREDYFGEPIRNRQRRAPTLRPIADIDDPTHTCINGTVNDRSHIDAKLDVVEVGMRIDDCRTLVTHFTVTLLARFRGLSGSFPRKRAA